MPAALFVAFLQDVTWRLLSPAWILVTSEKAARRFLMFTPTSPNTTTTTRDLHDPAGKSSDFFLFVSKYLQSCSNWLS